MHNYKQYVVSVAVGLALTFVTLFVPVTVSTQQQVSEVGLGLPARFVTQDMTAVSRPLPAKVTLSSPWENPTRISWGRFAVSLALFSVISFLMSFLLAKRKSNKLVMPVIIFTAIEFLGPDPKN